MKRGDINGTATTSVLPIGIEEDTNMAELLDSFTVIILLLALRSLIGFKYEEGIHARDHAKMDK